MDAKIRDKTNVVIILAIIAMIGCFYLFTIRAGHDWGDDFSHYLLHAKNLADGKSYSDTAYIPNSLYSTMSPKATYPVLPLILAPAYKLFGLNLTALKMVELAFFLGVLVILFLTYRRLLPFAYLVALILLVGLNPYFWDFKDSILSDIPFLFLVYSTLYAIQHYYAGPNSDRSSWSLSYACLVGVLIYLAYGTRAIGGLLLPALFVYEIVKGKGVSRFALSVAGIAGVLILAQGLLLPGPGGSYAGWIYEHARESILNLIASNVVTHSISLSGLWENGYNRAIKYGLYLMTLVLAAIGFRKRISDGVMLHEVFVIFYVLTLLVIPAHEFRYLFPVIPLYMVYVVIGTKELVSPVSSRNLQYAPLVLAVAAGLAYTGKFTTLNYGPMSEGVGRVESQELFQYIREKTQPTDVLVFRKPRALALFTGRRASIYPKPTDSASLWDGTAWNYFRDIGARYLVVAVARHAQGAEELRDIEWVQQFVARCDGQCKEVFMNADFRVYELEYLPGRDSVQRPVLNPPEAKRL